MGQPAHAPASPAHSFRMPGSGCLLAHCMGLGKTLQVVALVHTLLAHMTLTKVERVLVLLPVNVQLNWRHEFEKWTADCEVKIKLYELPTESGLNGRDLTRLRISLLEKWAQKGGVLLMGYTIFARLVAGVGLKPKKLAERFKYVAFVLLTACCCH